MSKIKVLVVEDEIIIADNICDTLEELGYEVTEPAINYTEAFIIIEEEKPDIAILDIQLSGKKTGIDIAKRIREEYNFPFIFLTSNADEITINEAKEVMPPAYLLKPFSKEDLYSALEIALSNFSKRKIITENTSLDDNYFFIKNKKTYKKIKQNDIFYVKSNHVYLNLVLKNGDTFLVRKSMSQILASLNNNFVRIHRSYIVNFKYVSTIENKTLIALDEEFPVGSSYKEELVKKIKSI